MFRFIGQQPMTGGLLYTDYEQNPFNRSGAREAHIHTDREREGISRITFFVFWGLKTCKALRTSRSVFFTIAITSHTM
jgi:hypothetical protein